MALDDFYYKEETFYTLGKAYVNLGDFYSDTAIIYLEKAKALGYTNDDLEEHRGLAYSRLGLYEQSMSIWTQVVEQWPTPSLYLTMGEDSFQLGNYEESRLYLKKAVELSNNEVVKLQSLLTLGELYFKIKNWVEAEKVLSQYLDIDYNNPDVHFMLGEVFFFMGDIASARKEWHRTERLDPKNRDALLRLYN